MSLVSDERVEELLKREHELCEALRPFAEAARYADLTKKGGDRYIVLVLPIDALRRAAELIGPVQ